MIEKNNIKIGDIVYSVNSWTNNVVKAKVTEIREDGVLFEHLCFVNNNGNRIDKAYGSSGAYWDNIFVTAKEAYTYRNENNNRYVSQYLESIKTVADLVKFPFTHCINGGEYTDWNAVKAYKIRAKELLGINLEKEKEL